MGGEGCGATGAIARALHKKNIYVGGLLFVVERLSTLAYFLSAVNSVHDDPVTVTCHACLLLYLRSKISGYSGLSIDCQEGGRGCQSRCFANQ